MDLFQKVKDMGIKFTYYVGGKAFDLTTQKRTTARDDIMRERKEKDEKRLEEDYGIYKEGY